MTYRGQNPVIDTVQIWNGSRWVSFDALSFSGSINAGAGYVWKDAEGRIGFSNAQSLEGLTHDLVNNSTATPAYVKDNRVVVLESPDEADVSYTMPIPVNGITPTASGVTRLTPKLVVEATVSVIRADGSDYSVQKWLAWWDWTAGGYGFRDQTILSNPADSTNLVVTFSDTGVGPSAPVITIGDSATSNEPRYFVEMSRKLFYYAP